MICSLLRSLILMGIQCQKLDKGDVMDGEQLATVPMDDLIKELLGRCDHGVVLLLQTRIKPTQNNLTRFWTGDSHACLGLCTDMEYDIIDSIREREHDGQ